MTDIPNTPQTKEQLERAIMWMLNEYKDEPEGTPTRALVDAVISKWQARLDQINQQEADE